MLPKVPPGIANQVAQFRANAIAAVMTGSWNPQGTHRSTFYKSRVSGVDYGGGEVVTGLSIDVSPGEIFAMIGPNGSGKSSTLNSLVGLAPKSRGRVVVGSTDVSRAPTSKIVAAGLVLVPEDRGLFPSMTVRDHLWLASRVRPPSERFDRAFDLD